MSFLTEALILSFAVLLFALPLLSARDWPSGRHAEFGQLSRVAYLRDESRLRPETRRHLFLDDPANWSWPKGDRVIGLSDSDVVLAPVLAEE